MMCTLRSDYRFDCRRLFRDILATTAAIAAAATLAASNVTMVPTLMPGSENAKHISTTSEIDAPPLYVTLIGGLLPVVTVRGRPQNHVCNTEQPFRGFVRSEARRWPVTSRTTIHPSRERKP
jgi:hypothetical protein